MLPMLLAYYIFSVLAVKYFNIKIALFWCAAFACSLAIGNIIFPKRHTRLFMALFILASAAFVTADCCREECGVMGQEEKEQKLTFK